MVTVLVVAALAVFTGLALNAVAVVGPMEHVVVYRAGRWLTELRTAGLHYVGFGLKRRVRVSTLVRAARVRVAWQVRLVNAEILVALRYKVSCGEAACKFADVDKVVLDLLHVAVGEAAPDLRVPGAEPGFLSQNQAAALEVGWVRDRLRETLAVRLEKLGMEVVDLDVAATRM